MSDTPETDAVEKHCEELVRAYHTDRMRVGDDRELAKVMIQVTRELLAVSRGLERKLASRPEARAQEPKRWTIELNDYQAANLLWLFAVCGYPYDNGQLVEPFMLVNNGDWIGEIPNMIRAQGEPSHATNDTAERLREKVKAWLSRLAYERGRHMTPTAWLVTDPQGRTSVQEAEPNLTTPGWHKQALWLDEDNVMQRAEDEANALLSKQVGDAQATAMEHLAGAILLAAVALAKSRLAPQSST